MRREAVLPSFVINFRAMKYDQFKIRVKNTTANSFCIIYFLIFISGSRPVKADIIPGAARFNEYVPQLKGKRIALVANHTSIVGSVHLLDTLISLGLQIDKIFAPEHGFRGDAANGATIADAIDAKSGLSIVSLYGKTKKPKSKDLKEIDAVVFDMQDVGVRYYTYLSTLHYVMEACAENHIELWVLDRPNPHGHYVDGPLLDPKFTQSMVGLHPIPLVHGMTLGELAIMIQGESWISHASALPLFVVTVENYDHNKPYVLPIAPSPNLPTEASVILYPSLGLFEGTIMSMGRGTDWPFEILGAPWFTQGTFEFTPINIPGKAVNPPYLGRVCKGLKLTNFGLDYLRDYQQIYLTWLMESYALYGKKEDFFNSFFDKLAGSPSLRTAIIAGQTEAEIRASWQLDLSAFKDKRRRYLLYAHDESRGNQYPTKTVKKP